MGMGTAYIPNKNVTSIRGRYGSSVLRLRRRGLRLTTSKNVCRKIAV